MNKKPRIGDPVHFVLNVGPNRGSHRPAIVVGVRDERTVNLQVFSDGNKSTNDASPNVFYKQGAALDETGRNHGTWHFPEPEEAAV